MIQEHSFLVISNWCAGKRVFVSNADRLRDLASYTALDGDFQFLLLKVTQKPNAATIIFDSRECREQVLPECQATFCLF